MANLEADWRVVDGMLAAWFDAPSLNAGSELAGRAVELEPEVLIDLRANGLRLRLAAPERADATSSAARELGLTANPSALQDLSLVLESPDPTAVAPFWQRALAYAPGDDGGLIDPLRRDFPLRVRRANESRPLRNRFHLDVVRPSAEVDKADLGDPYGPFGVCHADPDGNEVDLVPGDVLDESATDWQSVFSAVACYRTTSTAQQRDLAAAAASLADALGFPLLIDLRPGLVILDSGKDQSDADAHGLAIDFSSLAAAIQGAARDLGAVADPALPRCVQVVLDAADIPAVRAFWIAALGYVPDRREDLTDIVDPRRLNPVMMFQDFDVSDTERARQRNRTHVELAVPADLAQARVSAALGAGGRLVDESAGRWRIDDPEGNELVVVSGA
jgi:hypothetical protein